MSRPPAPPGSPRRFGALSTAQLRALLQDEPRLQRAARLSRKFQSLQLEREMCLASNCTLARVNLSLRPRLEDGKASLAIKYQELQEMQEACWDKQQRLEAYLEKWSPQSALGQLQAKLDASEAESEAQIKQFLAQDLPLDSFLESFCQSRTRSHICRTQLEKLQELLQKDQTPPPSPGTPASISLLRNLQPKLTPAPRWTRLPAQPSALPQAAAAATPEAGAPTPVAGQEWGCPPSGPVPLRGLHRDTPAGEHAGVGAGTAPRHCGACRAGWRCSQGDGGA
ncbi:vacuolar protein sorting-associated protein 37D isoform X2 [Columba livia]|uniref:vacuolar protein sorting-associated protein 37D isoform X2 n=1 Tax=Columba livia TaxID=8932 RepID=UPI0031B9B58F